jgi:hypothetical protein
VRRAERFGCEGESVDPATIWGGKRRMHRADDEGMRAMHKGRARTRGVRQGTRGEWLSRACRYRDGVTWSILVDSEAKATPYLTPPRPGPDITPSLCHGYHRDFRVESVHTSVWGCV